MDIFNNFNIVCSLSQLKVDWIILQVHLKFFQQKRSSLWELQSLCDNVKQS